MSATQLNMELTSDPLETKEGLSLDEDEFVYIKYKFMI